MSDDGPQSHWIQLCKCVLRWVCNETFVCEANAPFVFNWTLGKAEYLDDKESVDTEKNLDE